MQPDFQNINIQNELNSQDKALPEQPVPVQPKPPFWRQLLQNKKLLIFLGVITAWAILLLVYYFFRGQAEPMFEPTPVPPPTPTGAPVETSDLDDPSTWPTYTQAEGYSFKYPTQAVISKVDYRDGTRLILGDNVLINSEPTEGISVHFFKIPYQGRLFEDIVQSQYELISEDPLSFQLGNLNEVEVGGKTAEMFTFQSGMGKVEEYFFNTGEHVLRVSISYASESEKFLSVVNNILNNIDF